VKWLAALQAGGKKDKAIIFPYSLLQKKQAKISATISMCK